MAVYASIADLEAEARKRIPKPFFEYLENGAFTEHTMAANRRDLDATDLRERVLDAPGDTDMSVDICGQRSALPLILAPVGLSGMNRGGGEILAAEAARDYGVPYCLSTFSIASIEDVATAVGGDFWFQLYAMKDDGINESLVARAEKAGCRVLVLTVDCQTEGTRYRDIHNGLGVPPKLTFANVASIAGHPGWSVGMLHSPHWTFGNMIGEAPSGSVEELADYVKKALRPTIDRDFLAWLRKRWTGKLVIKGILSEPDLDIALAAGADAVVISNHGGRQLEGGMSTVKALTRLGPRIPPEVEILVDSGIRTGIDVLRMLGLGATACMIGRAYNYGLGAEGKKGVTIALDILGDELRRTMRLTGTASARAVRSDVIDV